MKRLNMYRIIFIINLLVLPVTILFNINLNDRVSLVEEEKNRLQLNFENSKSIKTIDCAYILENLGEDPHVIVKSIQNEKNNIYVNLNYYGDNEELMKFLNNVNSSKNFKSVKNLSMNNKKIKNNNDNYNDEKVNNYNDNNEEEQVDITLQYAKNLN